MIIAFYGEEWPICLSTWLHVLVVKTLSPAHVVALLVLSSQPETLSQTTTMSSFAEEKGTPLPSYQFNTAQPPPYPWTRNSSTGPNDPQKSPFIAQPSSISLHTAKPYIDIDVVPQRVSLSLSLTNKVFAALS